MQKNILLIDTDTLSLELLEIPWDVKDFTALFIWDETLFQKRATSQRKKEFVYAALDQIEELVLIQGNSQKVLEYLQRKFPESQLFYASRFQDRFETSKLLRVEIKYRVPKIEPLPRGFFSFYKKLRSQ